MVIHISNVLDCWFLCIHANILYLQSFKFSHFSGYVVVSYCSFNLYFPVCQWRWLCFPVSMCHLNYLFKYLCISIGLCFYWLVKILHSGHKTFVRCLYCKYSKYMACVFISLTVFLEEQVFLLIKSDLLIVFSLWFELFVSYLEIFPN